MTRHPLHWLPNVLTVLRCFMGVFVAYAVLLIAQKGMSLTGPYHAEVIQDHRQFWGGMALFIFIIAALTDALDGILARRWNAISRFGRLLDPIADKVVIGLPLIAIAYASGFVFPVLFPIAIIIGRDVIITILRFMGLGANAMAVSWLAKVKTFAEMIVLIVFLASLAFIGDAPGVQSVILTVWILLLWFAAMLSLGTGLGYIWRLIRPGHEEEPSNETQTTP